MKYLILCLMLALSSLNARPLPTEQYATANDGTPLSWTYYAAPTAGKHPVVLVIPGGGFRHLAGLRNTGDAAADLAQRGNFAVFLIQYHLAPPGTIPMQRSIGYYPLQTDDVHLAVLAARNDPRGNGQVGVLGGSAGGSHGAFVSLTGTPGVDRADIGVLLSGAYRFDDVASWNENKQFKSDVQNYVHTADLGLLYAASPASKVTSSAPPLYLIQSETEAMPSQQLPDLAAALDLAGVTNYQTLTLAGTRHSFDYYDDIADSAVEFLKTVLQ